MRRKEFEKIRVEIERDHFRGDLGDPLTYGLHRADFQISRLERLLAAAKNVTALTIQIKVGQWTRKLEKARDSKMRFQQMRKEASASKEWNSRPSFPVSSPTQTQAQPPA